jgi:predicted dehydrogenase
MDKVKVGVVGVGHLGQHHLRVYSELSEAELVGVYDIDIAKAKKRAEEFHTRQFENLNDLLKQTDAVSLVVPTSFHFSVGARILRSGVSVLIEKPITETVKQAEKLIELAKEKGLLLQVGHIERFNPAFRAIKNMKLEPKFIESHRLAPFAGRGTDVAVILDLMIHDIDLILSLVNDNIERIDAAGVSVITDREDIANARITFEKGCVVNITASRISAQPLRKLRMFQKNSYISLDLLEKSAEIYRLVETEKAEKETQIDSVIGKLPWEIGKNIVYERPQIEKQDMLTAEIKSFLGAVENKSQPIVSGGEGKRALEVALRIVGKVKEHREKIK